MEIKSEYEKEVLELLQEIVDQIKALRDDVAEEGNKIRETIYNN